MREPSTEALQALAPIASRGSPDSSSAGAALGPGALEGEGRPRFCRGATGPPTREEGVGGALEDAADDEP
eukprot:8179339-Pyramimonas_sp.AAC.1